MGSSRPHGSNAASSEWPIGQEPYWRTNSSFSPPHPRWDYRFQSEGIPYGSTDSVQLFGSTSSNSKESRSWIRGGYRPTHQYSASEGGALYFSSPSETSMVLPWTPPPMQGINIDEYEMSIKRGHISGPLPFTPSMEGSSMVPDVAGSTSSRSDGSEFEHTGKLHLSTPRNFPSRRSFMSKPIHPLAFPIQAAPTREPSSSFSPAAAGFDQDAPRLSSGSSSIDLTDISERYDPDFQPRASYVGPGEGPKCGLCDRLLSQRSPWSSRRIVRSGDLPTTGVLSCKHVFHAECLDQTTPKSQTSDPPCPLCSKLKRQNSPEHPPTFSRLRGGFPRLRTFSEEGPVPSRSWGCVQAGDCVEGALHTPQRGSLLLMSRNRGKKNVSPKGSSGKEVSGKLKKSGSYPLHFLSGRLGTGGGCSKTGAGPSLKK